MSRRRSRSTSRRARGTGYARADSERLVEKHDGNWWVRQITGATSTKTYRCPGCQQLIAPATPHMVVWPEVKPLLSEAAIDERRHWHRACWSRKT